MEAFIPDIELANLKNPVVSPLLATIIFAIDKTCKVPHDDIKKMYKDFSFITNKRIHFDTNLNKLCEFSWINHKKPKHKKEYIYVDGDKYEELLKWAFKYHFRDYSAVSDLFEMRTNGQILQDIMKEFVNSVRLDDLVVS